MPEVLEPFPKAYFLMRLKKSCAPASVPSAWAWKSGSFGEFGSRVALAPLEHWRGSKLSRALPASWRASSGRGDGGVRSGTRGGGEPARAPGGGGGGGGGDLKRGEA